MPSVRIRSLRSAVPPAPCACNVVFNVSIGVNVMRNKAAHADAKTVLIGDGKPARYPFELSNAKIPAFAAVSPNLATGPWTSAALIPW